MFRQKCEPGEDSESDCLIVDEFDFRLNGLLTKNTCQEHSAVSGVNPDAVSVQFVDPTVAGLERSLAARAFERLAERWQASRRPASALSTNGI